MNKLAAIAAFELALAILPPARADVTATYGNVLLLEQTIDVGQTRGFLENPNRGCSHEVIDGKAYLACVVTEEGDPLARPFIHSTITDELAGVALNAILRGFARRSRAGMAALKAATFVYPVILISNARNYAGISFKI